jgi:nucleoid DNA-binding protein
MSTRGINFFDRWMADHLPNAMTDDPIAVSDLADEMLKAAEREGIKAGEINEEVDSVFEVIFEAMHHREGNLPDSDQVVLDMLAERLAREAQLPKGQAAELIKRIGTHWDSLLNEAHFLKELEGRQTEK